MKLEQPRNYDFRVSQVNLPRPKMVTIVTSRLLHLAIIEGQQLHSQQPTNYNSCEPTTVTGQLLWNDRKGGTAQGGKPSGTASKRNAGADGYLSDTHPNRFGYILICLASIVEYRKTTLSTCPERTVAPDPRPRAHFGGAPPFRFFRLLQNLVPSDTKLLRKEFPENYFSSFLRDFVLSKCPGKKDIFKELGVRFVIFPKIK